MNALRHRLLWEEEEGCQGSSRWGQAKVNLVGYPEGIGHWLLAHS